MYKLVAPLLAAAIALSSPSHPLRPPNGRYVYAMVDDSGKTDFTSNITIEGKGPTFAISETTKLPNGPIATTKSTWSAATLLPLTFEIHQGKINFHAQITPAAVKFTDIPISFSRISGTGYVLPSVGLITNSLILPYAVWAHPGESLTLAEVQNNQTVLIQPNTVAPSSGGPAGDIGLAVTKDEEYGNSADQEQIVTWVDPKTGVFDGGRASPSGAHVVLRSFIPADH